MDINAGAEEELDYFSILEELSHKWMCEELDHTISKVASSALWKVAFQFIPKLIHARNSQDIKRKVPTFTHIRRTLYDNHTPEVNLEIGYKNKETNNMCIVQDTVTPKSKFPPHRFEKMYEVATVKVISNKLLPPMNNKLQCNNHC